LFDTSAVEKLKTAMRGPVLCPGDTGYDSVRVIPNAMIDRRPTVIARCVGAADVVASLRFAREKDMVVAVRGGGHSVAGSTMIRIIFPFHLRNLAHVGSEVTLEVEAPITQRSVLDALEARYPMLRRAIRDHDTQQRRPFLRFFACEEDLSHESPDSPLPDAVASGKEPLIVIGAIAGG